MNEAKQIRILSVDDHPLVRAGVAAVIANEPDMMLVGEAASAAEAIRRFRDSVPDVTLMDLRLADMSGIEATITIRQEFPQARVIILSVSDGDVEIQRALRAGVHSYVLKSMPPTEIIAAIRKVHAGKKTIPSEVATNLAQHVADDPLTGREIEVLQQIADGRRNRTIAQQLFISEETVKMHVKHMLEKLRATDRAQALVVALRRGIIAL